MPSSSSRKIRMVIRTAWRIHRIRGDTSTSLRKKGLVKGTRLAVESTTCLQTGHASHREIHHSRDAEGCMTDHETCHTSYGHVTRHVMNWKIDPVGETSLCHNAFVARN